MKHSFEKFCKDYTNIENYEKAKADNFRGWNCHHRLQTWTSDGERRLVDITADELKALDMYYNRPAEELIFLTRSEHSKLHKKGEHNAMYGKQGYWKGKTGPNKGKHHSEESKKKMSEAHKVKHFTAEHKKKLGAAKKGNTYAKGLLWFNNGKINKRVKECPKGFVPGRIPWKK